MSIINLEDLVPKGNYFLHDDICVYDKVPEICKGDTDSQANQIYRLFVNDCYGKTGEERCVVSSKVIHDNLKAFLSKIYFRPNVNIIDSKEPTKATNSNFSNLVKKSAAKYLKDAGITDFKDKKAAKKKDAKKKATESKNYGYKIRCHAPGIRSIMRMSDKRVGKMLRSNKFNI